jgi:phospholipase/carboxylesterase
MGAGLLDCVEINPAGEPDAVIIWLHGLGADGHDFEPIVPELELPEDLRVRFVFPHAPTRPIGINFGMVMRAWYDIRDADVAHRVDTAGILESADHLTALIRRETEAGIPSERIVIAGFSQGGVIALHTALRHLDPLAGVLALSTYLPTADSLAVQASKANRDTPILLAHGRLDPLIPIAKGLAARETLVGLGYSVEWFEYPMQHEVCMEEIRDIREWLLKVLKAGRL